MPVPMPCVSIVIADRHPVVLWGLKNILRDENGFIVVATCCDGAKSMQFSLPLPQNVCALEWFFLRQLWEIANWSRRPLGAHMA